jgi:hypothetical protein
VKSNFCGGRSDAVDGLASESLTAGINGSATAHAMRQRQILMGLTSREFVALQARPRSALQQGRLGYSNATWSTDATGSVLSNQYFQTLLGETWVAEAVPGTSITQYRAAGKQLYMMPTDLNLKVDTEWLGIAQVTSIRSNIIHITSIAHWLAGCCAIGICIG